MAKTYELYDVLYGPNGISDNTRYYNETLFHVTDIKFDIDEKQLTELLADERFDDFGKYCDELYYEILNDESSDEEKYDGPYKKPDEPNSISELLDVILGSEDGEEAIANYFYEKFGGQEAVRKQLAEVDVTAGKFIKYIDFGEHYNSKPDPEPDENGEWAKDEDQVYEYVAQYLTDRIGVYVESLEVEINPGLLKQLKIK